MNAKLSIHSIPEAVNCLVDCFYHNMDHEIPIDQRYYILSHFHSDHYRGISKSWNRGRIICSEVTANLLMTQYNINISQIIILGINCTIVIRGRSLDMKTQEIAVTFLDANHCPGAVIITFQLASGKYHIHCGDMRYHPRMKLYPKLQEIVERKESLERLYLDTTYADKKHTFMSQDESIDLASSLASDFITKDSTDDWLILVCAYTIGKEKLFNAIAEKINANIFMDKEKLDVLSCLGPSYTEGISRGRYSSDRYAAPIHICPMNLVGSVTPIFHPNFDSIQSYMDEYNRTSSGQRHAHRVLAFLPTGWSTSSKYNRNHPSAIRENIAIHLIPYSEHSQFNELMEFVRYLKPKEVVPTVFSDVSSLFNSSTMLLVIY